jgi:hypothetical protein
MNSAPTNKVVSAKKPRPGERARARIIVLVLVSFLLGVAVTASWFHYTASRLAENSSSQTNDQPATEQPINATAPAQPFVPSHPPVDAATIAAVKQAVPDYASLSLEDGTQILRAAALKQFAAAAREMDAQVKQAQEQLVQAESNQAAGGQPATLKHLQETQVEQTEKLQQIAAQLQAQIAALKQLKNAK